MQAIHADNFQKLLVTIGEIYSREVSKPVIKIYWEILKKYDYEAVKNAFYEFISKNEDGKFFPKPAQIVEILEGKSEEHALTAWLVVQEAIQRHGAYSAVSFEDKLISATVNRMGGWPRLCAMETSKLDFYRKNFEEIYQHLKKNPPENLPAVLPGLFHDTKNAVLIPCKKNILRDSQEIAAIIELRPAEAIG